MRKSITVAINRDEAVLMVEMHHLKMEASEKRPKMLPLPRSLQEMTPAYLHA
jgi:hypothetical protein